MPKQKSFSILPKISMPYRTKMARPKNHATSFNLGTLIPVYLEEVLPGDTVKIDLAAIIRGSTPIAPVMGNSYIDFYAFYCPNRILWDHWEEFCGVNKEGYWTNNKTYNIPHLETLYINPGFKTGNHSLLDYTGLKDLLITNNKEIITGTKTLKTKSTTTDNYQMISLLPFRGLAKIWNEYFRDENTMKPLLVNTSDENLILNAEYYDTDFLISNDYLKVSKYHDAYTSALPAPQKGPAVTIPLGESAPVLEEAFKLQPGNKSSETYDVGVSNYLQYGTSTEVAGNTWIAKGLKIDLSEATAAQINSLRFAFQYQKYLEKNARGGTRYNEFLEAHWGTSPIDSVLQRPEYLGHIHKRLNIQQVLSTSGYTNDDASTLGQTGAQNTTALKDSIFTKSFTEYGYLYIVACARTEQTYSNGIEKMWTRKAITDFYLPEFSCLGEQPIHSTELVYKSVLQSDNITYQPTEQTIENIFGYQEYGYEYRYSKSLVTGYLNPANPESLDFWTYANNFKGDTTPTVINEAFLKQDRNAYARTVVTGNTGPDFIADIFFDTTWVRSMPMFSIPGLIDHF